MRVAGLYDIHGNLPALEAVIQDVRNEGVDRVVVGGDVVTGPMPREALRLLVNLEVPVQFVHGNCELAVLAQMTATAARPAAYWGTTSGAPLPEPLLEVMRWTARQLDPEYKLLFAKWPKTLRLQIDGLGEVLFCHSTPRSETEIFTRLTPEDRLLRVFDRLRASVVVCGHTHMQFDRMVGSTRIVNAGSVGMPFGATGAFWVLLGPDVRLRRTDYDLRTAAEIVRATQYPQAQEDAHDLVHPPREEEMLAVFGKAELK